MKKINIGQEIIILRARNGWTQQQFAERLKTTQRTVAAWESGDSTPRKVMKVRIAQAFGLPDDYFLAEDDILEKNTRDGGFRTDLSDRDEQKRELVGQIDDILSRSQSLISEEKKNLFLEVFQDMLDIPK